MSDMLVWLERALSALCRQGELHECSSYCLKPSNIDIYISVFTKLVFDISMQGLLVDDDHGDGRRCPHEKTVHDYFGSRLALLVMPLASSR